MDNRTVTKPQPPSTSQIYLKFAAQMTTKVMTSCGQHVASSLLSAYNYLKTPSPPLLKPAKSRYKTDYKANATASIALPDRPKQKIKACQPGKTNHPEPSSTLYYFFNSVAGLFSSPLSLQSREQQGQTKPATKKRSVKNLNKYSNEDINVKMIALVKAYKALKAPLDKDYAEAERILLEQIDLVEHEIMEHAERRVDLYFYTLVAVYQQNALIEKKSTNKQHGSGTNERGTNGCHDSLFPHVKMHFPKTLTNLLWSYMYGLPAIRGTHFEDSNNMTTELPKLVNDFDTYLELSNPGHQSGPSKYLKLCLEDLNLVSKGSITPIDGMNRFLKIIKRFFADFEVQHLKGKTLAYPKVMQKIWELQYVATLRAQSFESDTIDIQYICSLLRTPPHDVTYYVRNPNALLKRCMQLQSEIMNAPSIVDQKRKLK